MSTEDHIRAEILKAIGKLTLRWVMDAMCAAARSAGERPEQLKILEDCRDALRKEDDAHAKSVDRAMRGEYDDRI